MICQVTTRGYRQHHCNISISSHCRSLEQILIGCVHQACQGLTLNQPKPDTPYEIKFIVHPAQEEFCISKIIILSEARNLELYINGSYEKSSRGVMLTMNKGRQVA